jgi:ABC-type transport system substrate-binding protein
VKRHDGHPFTSKDVTYTFDMLREAPHHNFYNNGRMQEVWLDR